MPTPEHYEESQETDLSKLSERELRERLEGIGAREIGPIYKLLEERSEHKVRGMDLFEISRMVSDAGNQIGRLEMVWKLIARETEGRKRDILTEKIGKILGFPLPSRGRVVDLYGKLVVNLDRDAFDLFHDEISEAYILGTGLETTRRTVEEIGQGMLGLLSALERSGLKENYAASIRESGRWKTQMDLVRSRLDMDPVEQEELKGGEQALSDALRRVDGAQRLAQEWLETTTFVSPLDSLAGISALATAKIVMQDLNAASSGSDRVNVVLEDWFKKPLRSARLRQIDLELKVVAKLAKVLHPDVILEALGKEKDPEKRTGLTAFVSDSIAIVGHIVSRNQESLVRAGVDLESLSAKLGKIAQALRAPRGKIA